MARHAAPSRPIAPRALLRAGLTLGALGAALTAGAGAAQAAEEQPGAATGETLSAVTGAAGIAAGALDSATTHSLGPVKDLQINPLAGTGTDPLDNTVGTQVADFQPVSTAALTGPLSDGGSLTDLPLVGQVAGLLPG
ncbi:hypothetical protein ACIPPN_04745 [Streptomyces diastaticus]|uniref:Secreted protein n=1 Tax=Streptomyces griseus TaxID=1911 RepID=A0A380PBN6_STRGR|nr:MULTISPECIES: hypothetical protein [Streptomyces]RPK91708.1 hypothetical protein EES47_04755 [Streptomyces sp. ADI98-12]SUP62338.1 Uncharacterised protein [Streptomyces griseus]